MGTEVREAAKENMFYYSDEYILLFGQTHLLIHTNIFHIYKNIEMYLEKAVKEKFVRM